MPFFQQFREIFRFELSLQWRQAGLWLSLLACVALGAAMAGTDMGGAEVAVGRIDRNAPFAVLHNLAGLSAAGMFIVLITVAQGILRDFNTGIAPLILSTPIRTTAYIAGRFLAGYCAALMALLAGVAAMAIAQQILQTGDPSLGPVPWSAFLYGVVVLVMPNLLMVGLVVLLLGVLTRRIGATFLGLLPVMIGQDIAEALPVETFGYQLPALLDPLGLAALKGVTHTWTVGQFAESMPSLTGDLLLNRLLWLGVSVLIGFLAVALFQRRARGAMLGPRGRRAKPRFEGEQARGQQKSRVIPELRGAPRVVSGRALRRVQAWATLRFELGRLLGSLSFKVMLVSGLAMVGYSMWQGDEVSGVRLLPSGQLVAQSIRRASTLTMTLMVVLFTGEVVWRERSTRMALTLDSYPVGTRTLSAAKMAAACLVLMGTVAIYGALAWWLQFSQAGKAAPLEQVLAAVGNEFLGALQLASAGFFLQALCGGRISGYMAMGIFLAGRLVLRLLGYTGALYSFAAGRIPFLSDMNGLGNGVERWLLTQAYWTAVALALAMGAAMLWPRGTAHSKRERLDQVRARLARGGRWSLLGAASVAVLCALFLHRQTLAAGKGWDRTGLENFLMDYEQEYADWRDRPRPEVVDLRADLTLQSNPRRLRVRGQYTLVNKHAGPIEELLVSHDPDLIAHGHALGRGPSDPRFDFEGGPQALERANHLVPLPANAGGVPGTHILTFEPALAPGDSATLEFDLEFDPEGWGPRPADRWLVENGTFLLAGPGTHAFFRGAQGFLTLGYDPARELQRTKPREDRGLGPWDPWPTPGEYLAKHGTQRTGGARAPGFGGADWVRAELWIHTEEDQRAVAPGDLIERHVEDGVAHHHFKTRDRVQAFFPVMSGRYELARASHGNTQLEVYHHSDHGARVDHLIWAMQRSLAYFEKHWGPFPHETLRLAEIPGFAGSAFACSFPGGMMGFTDSMGFRYPRGEGGPIEFPARGSEEASPADVDPILWTVAHEVAHQWWDSHVIAAMAQGASFTSESMAQYGSLCVLQEEYGDPMALRVAEYNRERYLQGRRRADRKELPLVLVDDQSHVHYGKGFVAFHALSKLAGHGPIDRACATIVREFAGEGGTPVASVTVVDRILGELPPALVPRAKEWFEEIRFLDGTLASGVAERRADGKYAVTLRGSARSLLADGEGNEEASPFDGELELSITLDGRADPERLRVSCEGGQFHLEQTFETRPVSACLDPRMLHLDRDLSDNQITLDLLAQ